MVLRIVMTAMLLLALSLPALAAPLATVQTLTPQAWAVSQGQRLELSEGSEIEADYSLHTSAQGGMEVRFSDGTQMRMGPSTSVEIRDYAFSEQSAFAAHLAGGTMDLVTGAIVERNPEGFQVTMPLATVGIRGTSLSFSAQADVNSVAVTHMSDGHQVLVTGADGQTTIIPAAGLQVDIMRGQPTPASPMPIAGSESDSPGTREDIASLPHRDLAEQQFNLVEQQIDVPLLVVHNDQPPVPVPPPIPRATYPAFVMGVPLPTNFSSALYWSSMSGSGERIGISYTNSAMQEEMAVWNAQTGSYRSIYTHAAFIQQRYYLSGDGGTVMVSLGADPTTTFSLNMNSNVTTSTVNMPADMNSNMLITSAMNYSGTMVAAQYDSLVDGQVLARMDLDTTLNQWNVQRLVLPGTNTGLQAYARGISNDGSIIVGQNTTTSEPVYYRQVNGVEYSENIIYNRNGWASAVSDDGMHVAGYVRNIPGTGFESFYLNTSSNSTVLISGAATDNVEASHISNNGQVIAGRYVTTGYNGVFFWTPDLGLTRLDQHLASHGINMGGIDVDYVAGISSDGAILLVQNSLTSYFSGEMFLVRLDGDTLGLVNQNNYYASIAGVPAGTTVNDATQAIMSQLHNVSLFQLGNVPAAGDYTDGSVLRVWGTGAFMSNDKMNGDDNGFIGGAGATWFLENGFSLGASAFYGYRGVEGVNNSKQSMDSMSFGLIGGYAPELTGIRLSLGVMGQSYSLDTRRNYLNGMDMATSSGKGSGWGLGLTSHAGWVFALHDKVTIQPFIEYTFQRIATPDYEESGGPFPASFDRQYFNQNITRLGADLQWDVLPELSLQLWLAWNHRFEDEGPASSGQIIGWQSFYLNGSELKQNWGDTGIGLRFRVYDNTTLGARLGFGIDNDNSGLPDVTGSLTISVDL